MKKLPSKNEMHDQIMQAGTTAVLACMQSEVTSQEIKNELCLSVIKATRRIAGLAILGHVSSLLNQMFVRTLDSDHKDCGRLYDFVCAMAANVSYSLNRAKVTPVVEGFIQQDGNLSLSPKKSKSQRKREGY